ncbi:hypothetical protein [Halobellus salinisoli]|uniref:arsenate reductase/protein-tyrosine-phosphatase family protein n=1 Tax=Halobellus salinisoli TaxID=3108500 RepID=UPI00300BDD15
MSATKAFLSRLRGKSLGDLLRLAPQFASELLRFRAIGAFYWGRLHATPTARRRRRRAALDRLSEAESVLFLCHGNVCRSPFAERLLRHRLVDRGLAPLEVASAGSVELDDPRSPSNARAVAAEFGVGLSSHRAMKSTDEAIETADLLFVMDYRNYHTYATRYPEAVDRLFLLRIVEPGHEMQIIDPHGSDESTFERVYAAIDDCVTTMLDEYEARRGGD